MNSIDTNVLVRLIVNDHKQQSKKALALINKEKQVLITHVVLCETSWVLESCYKLKKAQIITVIENILKTSQFEFEDTEAVWAALLHYKQYNADFSDCLIGAISWRVDEGRVKTFDKKSGKLPGFDLI